MQIHRSAARGDIEGVRRQLDRGVDVDTLLQLTLYPITPLAVAAGSPQAGTPMLQFLLDHGADPNAAGGEDTPLSCAARADDPEKVALLLRAGARAGHVSPAGYTAATAAATAAGARLLQVLGLLRAAGTPLDTESRYGESVLSVLSHRGRLGAVAQVLAWGTDPSPLVWTPLHHAVAFGASDDVRRRAAEAPEELRARDRWGRTPWLVALMTGDIAKADTFVQLGADIADAGRCGSPLLAHPALNDQVELFRWLLDRGADPQATDDFGSPVIVHAAQVGAAGCLQALLERGLPLQGVERPRDTSIGSEVAESIRAAMREVREQYPDMPTSGAEQLLNSLRERATGGRQWYAISEAATLEVARLLVAAGADVDQVGPDGYWLLKTTIERGDVAMTTGLLQLGASVHTRSTGSTALHTAISHDSLEIASVLIRHGADVNARDVDDWTPLHLARSEEAVRLLLDHGADPHCRAPGSSPAEVNTDPYVRDVLQRLAGAAAG